MSYGVSVVSILQKIDCIITLYIQLRQSTLIYTNTSSHKIYTVFKISSSIYTQNIYFGNINIDNTCKAVLATSARERSTRGNLNHTINGLVQERCNSSALLMELRLSCINPSTWNCPARMILEMGSSNERWHYNASLSLIGWAHTQNDSLSRHKSNKEIGNNLTS